MDPSYNPWATPMFPNTGSAYGVGSPAEAAERQPTFVDSLLSHIAGALGRGFMGSGGYTIDPTLSRPDTSQEHVRFTTASPLANITDEDINRGVNIGMAAGPLAIKAYHGSPHDFDRFDLSKIGTGEGAQAYGHGLYFAENEGVARSYRDALARTVNTGDPRQMAAAAVGNHGGDRSAAIQFLRENLAAESAKKTPDAAWIAKYSPVLRELESNSSLPASAGKMYEVNINAEPSHFLDWDKPLTAQSGPVTKAFEPDWSNHVLGPNATGKDLYEWISGGRANRGSSGMPRATNDLMAQDVPGIRYLDQGSRGAGQGSSNYVVFNDKLIDILKKYAIPGMMGAPIFAPTLMGENKQ